MKIVSILKNLLRQIYFEKRWFNVLYCFLFGEPHFEKLVEVNCGEIGVLRVCSYFKDYDYRGNVSSHNPCLLKWPQFSKGKAVIFDVGAHVGLYLIPACKAVKTGGMVYGFEPSFMNAYFLRKHCSYNQVANFRLFPLLVGDKKENKVCFYEYPGNSTNSIVEKKNYLSKRFKPQINLDQFCEENRIFPELIKIDVEGAEANVFKGCVNLLERQRPVIFLSVHPVQLARFRQSPQTIQSLLDQYHYQVFDANEHLMRELKADEEGEYILIPEERSSPRHRYF